MIGSPVALVRIRRRERFNRRIDLILVTSIALLAAASFAWVVA